MDPKRFSTSLEPTTVAAAPPLAAMSPEMLWRQHKGSPPGARAFWRSRYRHVYACRCAASR